MLKRNQKGFTLIELIVVVAVMGILVFLATPNFMGHTKKAKLTRVQNDIKITENKVEELLVKEDKEFDKWSDISSSELESAKKEKRLYGRRGLVAEDNKKEASIEGGNYKLIPENFVKKEVRSRLGGKFYANNEGRVYYEDTKTNLENDKSLLEWNKYKIKTVVDANHGGENWHGFIFFEDVYQFPGHLNLNKDSTYKITIKGFPGEEYKEQIEYISQYDLFYVEDGVCGFQIKTIDGLNVYCQAEEEMSKAVEYYKDKLANEQLSELAKYLIGLTIENLESLIKNGESWGILVGELSPYGNGYGGRIDNVKIEEIIFLETVSGKEGDYPDNGIQDGYLYIKNNSKD